MKHILPRLNQDISAQYAIRILVCNPASYKPRSIAHIRKKMTPSYYKENY